MADSVGGIPFPPGGQPPRRPGSSPPAAPPVAGPGQPDAGQGEDRAAPEAPPGGQSPEVPADGFQQGGKIPGHTGGKTGSAPGTGTSTGTGSTPGTGTAPGPGIPAGPGTTPGSGIPAGPGTPAGPGSTPGPGTTPGPGAGKGTAPAPQAAPAADTFVPFTGAVRLSRVAGEVPPPSLSEPASTGLDLQGAGWSAETEGARYESPDRFPPEIAIAFEAIAAAPFGVKTGGHRTANPAALQALFKQYQVIPHEVLKRAPAVCLFLNTVVAKYPPSEIRRMAERGGVDLQRVLTALVLDPPALPALIARVAADHQLGADRAAVLRQAEQLAAGADPLGQLAGKFVKTVLSSNPQALQAMLTDPLTFFSAQLWNRLGRDPQVFIADARKTRQATGLLQRGGLSARGLAWLMGESHDGAGAESEDKGSGQGQPGPPPGAHELYQQKAFYDTWRESLIKGIKEASDARAGRLSGPPVVETLPLAEAASSRALYDPTRKVLVLGAAHAHPDCMRLQTSGLCLTVAPDGGILEISLLNPRDRWEVKKDLKPPVVAGLEPSRARIAAPRDGAAYATHDRFYTSQDRNVIYLQVEKRPVARRALAATNVLLELDDENHLLGIVIWQLAASRPGPSGDQKAWIAGLAERGPHASPS